MKTLILDVDLKELHHEFHTPLTGSLGMARLLIEEKNLTTEQHEMVDAIIKSNERLLDFIDHHVLNSPVEESESKKVLSKRPTLFLRLSEEQSFFNKKIALSN